MSRFVRLVGGPFDGEEHTALPNEDHICVAWGFRIYKYKLREGSEFADVVTVWPEEKSLSN